MSRPSIELWPLAFLVLLVLNNLAETNLAERTSLHWVTYMIIFLSIRLHPRRSIDPANRRIADQAALAEKQIDGTISTVHTSS